MTSVTEIDLVETVRAGVKKVRLDNNLSRKRKNLVSKPLRKERRACRNRWRAIRATITDIVVSEIYYPTLVIPKGEQSDDTEIRARSGGKP